MIRTNSNNRKPKWLRVKLPTGKNYKHVRKLVSDNKLHTICESGNCPNMGECWGEGTATFMIWEYLYSFMWFLCCSYR